MLPPPSYEVMNETLKRTKEALASSLAEPDYDPQREAVLVAELAACMVRLDALGSQLIGYRITAQLNDGHYSQVPVFNREQLRERLGSITPWQLTEGYLLHQPLSPLANYHLAIYYNTLAAGADKIELRAPCSSLSKQHLSAAVIDPEVAEHAQANPEFTKITR